MQGSFSCWPCQAALPRLRRRPWARSPDVAGSGPGRVHGRRQHHRRGRLHPGRRNQPPPLRVALMGHRDEEDYICQTAEGTTDDCIPQSDNAPASGNDCIMGGTSALLWFITIDTTDYAPSYAASLASPIVSALHGQLVTRVPASWCNTAYCPPAPAPAPSTQSPNSSPSSSPSPFPSHSAPPPPPAPTPPASAPTSASGAWCTATASVYNARYNWNNVYVHSNQQWTPLGRDPRRRRSHRHDRPDRPPR